MTVVLLIIFAFVLLFGFVVFFGPPYLPTKKRQIEAALDLLDLQSGQTLLELGSGDGRVMLAAARRGWRVVGIEINPLLVLLSRLYTWRYRRQTRVIWGNYFWTPWPQADAVFTFMIPRHMAKLDRRIEQWHQVPLKLASFAFRIPNKKPAAIRTGIFLYEYQ